MDVCDLTALELSAALRQRELSAVEALEAVLARADEIATTVNPFTIRLDDRARAAARDADVARLRGDDRPLLGVPVSTKDSHWMAGVESTCGSRTRVGFVPEETVGGITALLDSGAVVFARTTVPEFCYFGVTESALFGRTANPWDLGRTCGGSSGGAAAAVAAGCGPLSLGGDGGGSIRIPAAFCGLVGFKPTFGLVSHEPSTAGWKTLVSLGPLARTVADARLMLAAVAREDPRDRHSLPAGPLDVAPPAPGDLVLAVSEDLGFAPVDDDVRRAFHACLDRLAAAGVRLVEDHPGLSTSVRTWGAIALTEAHFSESDAFLTHREELTPAALEFIAAGGYVSTEEYVRAQFAREQIFGAYADLLTRTGAHALLTPTLGCQAFPHGSRHPESIGSVPIGYPDLDWAPFLYDANLAGLPACALPMGLGDDGLPVSVQLLGRRRDDGRVLAAAETVESILGLDLRPPAQPVPTLA